MLLFCVLQFNGEVRRDVAVYVSQQMIKAVLKANVKYHDWLRNGDSGGVLGRNLGPHNATRRPIPTMLVVSGIVHFQTALSNDSLIPN